jgi:hypothetical protein
MHVKQTERVCHILALGGSSADGHLRVARGNGFDVVQGDEATHAAMLDLCLRIQRALDRKGKRLEDISREEFTALLRELAP